MDVTDLYAELYGRLPPLARSAVDGLGAPALARRLTPQSNSVAWLVWHAARVEDHHVSELRGTDQLWVAGSYAARLGLEPDPQNTGYGHHPDDVASIAPRRPDDLLAYGDAVHAATVAFLAGLSAAELDTIVDRRFDPPVTMGVRLVSVADDALQHLGQANFLRGILAS